MGGGLLQLVAYGAQDVYLTGNPQITFWKVSYRRYTNFSMESIQQTFSGSPAFGQRVTCQISRNGDLVHKAYLEVPFTAGTAARFINGGLFALVKSIEVEIGGQRIDKHYGHWMYIWNKLSLPAGKTVGFKQMTGATFKANNAASDIATGTTFYLPLEFWFCRNPGLALPLIALQYHEVKINIEFSTGAEVQDGGAIDHVFTGASLWFDYIFLDTDERRRMAQNPHEYLIDQLQRSQETITGTTGGQFKLNFNHPVKELVWTTRPAFVADDHNNFTNNENNNGEVLLKLNGHDRFSKRPSDYFRLVQPLQHHTAIPLGSTNDTFCIAPSTASQQGGIQVYSFALRPEEHQPSGTCNFSRIDSAILEISGTGSSTAASRLDIYAVNYNVLRVMSGMGGLAYSN